MSKNRHGIDPTVTLPTGDVFTARMMAKLLNTARRRSDGAIEIEMTPKMFEDVIDSMERDGISINAELATVSAREAGEIAALRPNKN